MPRFSYQDQIATSASVDESIDAARSALAELGAKPRAVDGVADGVVVGGLGSRLRVRLIGLTFGSVETLPIKIRVEVIDQGTDRSIRLDVAEDFGFGSLAGVEGKCRTRCQVVLAKATDGVASRLPHEPAAATTTD